MYTAFTSPAHPDRFYVSRWSSETFTLEYASLRCGSFTTHQAGDQSEAEARHIDLDLAFYDDKTLSLLVEENGGTHRPVLVQLPLSLLHTHDLFRPCTTCAEDCSIDLSDISLHESVASDSRDALGAGKSTQRSTVLISGGDDSGGVEMVVDLDRWEGADVSALIGGMSSRALDNIRARQFAVSGTRKVACVLFASRRRVRLFLMDVEDDESSLLLTHSDSHRDDSTVKSETET